MKYACSIALGALLMFASVAPTAAQDRNGKPTVVVRDGNDEHKEVRKRGRTNRDDNVRSRGKSGRVDGRGANSSRRSGDARRAESTREREHAPVETRRRGGDDIFRDRRDAGAKAKQGNGPPFCRNGNGHPVHGRQWCVDKGWGLGSDRDILNRRRQERRNPNRNDDRTILDDVLGRRYSVDILGRRYDAGIFERR